MPSLDRWSRAPSSLPFGWVATVFFLAVVFAIRLAFGLVGEFWGVDESQIFLIGLKFFTTGVWPYYGPDVVYTDTQIPGGLQGLLVGGPLWIVPQPEAPFVLLNLLSLASLCLLAWYIARREPSVPWWCVWLWVLFSPWTLNLSTHIVNPSYVLTGASLFFVGASEALPFLRRHLLPLPVAFFCMGFGTCWVLQLHLSGLLLGPILVVVLACAAAEDWRAGMRGLLWSALGASISGATLIPTILHVGWAHAAGAGANIEFAPANILRLPQILAQLMSFASFELPRFIGAGTNDRLQFLARAWWAAPFAIYAALYGMLQAGVLIAGLFLSRRDAPQWRATRLAMAALFLLLGVSFAFSIRSPVSHAFYFALPAVMIYAFACWAPMLQRRAVRASVVVLLVAGAVTHVAIARRNFEYQSLYTNRALVVRAIRERNHHLVGERRPDVREGHVPPTASGKAGQQ